MTDVAASPGNSNVASATPDTMSWDSRARRVMMIYLPLSCFVLILLFPFYWMAITSVKPDYEMYDYKQYNPFWVHSPTLDNIRKLLFETEYPRWLLTTMASTRTGLWFASYSTVTWLLPSGRRYGMVPFLRTSLSLKASLWASEIGVGINSGVSLVA